MSDVPLTQPIRRRWILSPAALSATLMSLAALFVTGGAVLLHLDAPTRFPLSRLLMLVGIWGGMWGGAFLLLRRHRPTADPFLLPIVALLTGWGLLLLARLAPVFLPRQLIWLSLGVALLCAIALRRDLPRLLRRYRYTLLTAGLLLLGATLVFGVNPSGYGQRLWLGFAHVYFQPSEPLKLILVIYLAAYLSERRGLLTPQAGDDRPLWLAALGPVITMVGVALLLLGWQQDLGAALLFYFTFVALLYLAWGKQWLVLLSVLLFVPVMAVGTVLSARVALRVSIWLNPWAPAQADRAFQILQSLFAQASGGLIGQGLGMGAPTLIPAVHTDFVYAALVEEFGLGGAIALGALIALLVSRGVLLAQEAESPFESLLAGGIAALLGIQTWVILAGNTKLIPITGVTLPFLSYGGSSLLTMMAASGLLLNLSAPHPPTLCIMLPSEILPPLPKTAGRLGKVLLVLLASVLLETGFWAVVRADKLRAYPSNPRLILAEARIRRGRIEDRTRTPLADIDVGPRGYVTRTYPVPQAAPVVGYTTLRYGAAGIEDACDQRLRGEETLTPWQSVWNGLLHRAPEGHAVRLTLDAPLQIAAQQMLTGHVGAVVLVDAHTGAILALASSPTYDPATVAASWDSLRDDPASPLLNRATQGLAQPGTILGTVIVGAALQANVTPVMSRPLDAPVAVDGAVLTCRHAPQGETWEAGLAAACPAPLLTLGSRLGSARLQEAFELWGLISPLSLTLPTATPDWPPETFRLRDESVGQGHLLVTPLHMAAVAAVLGNDGVRPPLHLLAEPQAGCTPEHLAATPVISSEVAAQLRHAWPHYGDIIGTPGDALAGPERTLSWFLALNSRDVPRYAVAVMLENEPDPQLAATIAARLLQQVQR